MSLRPAQALVAESSRFNLRTFFEAREAAGEPMPPPLAGTGLVPSAPPPVAGTTGAMPPSPTLPPLNNLPKLATREHNKFTFNGLVMPSSAQHTNSTTGVAGGLSAAAVASAMSSASSEAIASENLRLKAQAHTLNDKVAQLTAHLATTSESVMRGNKALVAERAQFQAQYSALAEKLKDTQAQLVEAEAAPEAAMKNEKLLTAKILELQAENDRLSASADGSELLKKLEESREMYSHLSAQHSVLLDKFMTLEDEHGQQTTMLNAAQAEVAAAQALSDSYRVEAANADSIVDHLDAKLADARATGACGGTHAVAAPEEEEEGEEGEGGDAASEAGTETKTGAVLEAPIEAAEVPAPVAACCPKTLRCEELQRAADDAKSHAETCCGDDEVAEVAWERHAHLQAVATRAWSALASGNPETATAVHLFSDPLHEDVASALDLSAHITPTAYQRGAHYEGHPLCCEGPACCSETGSEYQALTTQARTNSYIEAVSRDLKLSMDGSQLAYANSMKTGVAVRV